MAVFDSNIDYYDGDYPLQEALLEEKIAVSDTSNTTIDDFLMKLEEDLVARPGAEGKSLLKEAVMDETISVSLPQETVQDLLQDNKQPEEGVFKLHVDSKHVDVYFPPEIKTYDNVSGYNMFEGAMAVDNSDTNNHLNSDYVNQVPFQEIKKITETSFNPHEDPEHVDVDSPSESKMDDSVSWYNMVMGVMAEDKSDSNNDLKSDHCIAFQIPPEVISISKGHFQSKSFVADLFVQNGPNQPICIFPAL